MLLKKDKILAAGLSDLLIKVDKMYNKGHLQGPDLDSLNATIYQIVDEQPDCVQNIVTKNLVKHFTGYNLKGANK